MRISVAGNHASAKTVAGYLGQTFVVTDEKPDYRVQIDSNPDPNGGVVFDSIDSPVEAVILAHCRKITPGDITVRTLTGNRDESRIVILLPGSTEVCYGIERGIVRGFLDFTSIGKIEPDEVSKQRSKMIDVQRERDSAVASLEALRRHWWVRLGIFLRIVRI